ncbi:MAG: hypothetical protein ACRCZE_05335 [Candidatus Altimarinota bacterium]
MNVLDSIKNIITESQNPEEDLKRMLDVGLHDPMEEEKTLSGAEQEICDWVRQALCEHGFIKAKLDLKFEGVPQEKLELYDEIIIKWQKENAQRINVLFPPKPSLFQSANSENPEPDLDF